MDTSTGSIDSSTTMDTSTKSIIIAREVGQRMVIDDDHIIIGEVQFENEEEEIRRIIIVGEVGQRMMTISSSAKHNSKIKKRRRGAEEIRQKRKRDFRTLVREGQFQEEGHQILLIRGEFSSNGGCVTSVSGHVARNGKHGISYP
ncbi:hypothetical protein Dimus_033384, partial [Dionaea muscipula]